MTKLSKLPFSLLLLVALAEPVMAHDFWIEPSSFRPVAKETVKLRLRVGERYQGDPISRDNAIIVRFESYGSGKAQPVPAAPRADPAGLLQADHSSGILVVYQSRPSIATMAKDKFEQYVREEGLEPFVKGWKWPSAISSTRDAFSRNAKTFLAGPGAKQSGYDRVTGLPLELVPVENPNRAAPGRKVTFRLLHGGLAAPPGVLVVATPKGRPTDAQPVRTDKRGRVTFTINRADEWLIKAVLLKPSADRKRSDWESMWASYTFRADP